MLPLTLKKHLPRDRDHPGSVSRRFSEAWGIQLMAEGLNQSQSSEFGRCGSDLSGDFWHKPQGLCIYIYTDKYYIFFHVFHWVDQKGVSCCLISRNRLPMILPFFCWGEARRRDESLDRLGPLEKNGPPWTNRTSLVSVGWNCQNFDLNNLRVVIWRFDGWKTHFVSFVDTTFFSETARKN